MNANTFENNYYGTPRLPFKADLLGWRPGRRDHQGQAVLLHQLRGADPLGRPSSGACGFRRRSEKKGDFSETLIAGPERQSHDQVQIYDPFNVTKIGPNLYQRAAVPNSIIPNPNRHALKLFSYYPDPNQTASEPYYNSNNYYHSGKQTFGKDSINSRVDYRLGNKHSIYGAGGILKGSIEQPEAVRR